tara:strand:+ start:4014 stop:4544 length:531 start_codon:yes stop_codon:yes gene_type:complete
MYNFNHETLLNWITAFAIFEIPMALFYLSISKKSDMVTDWYSGKTINIWNVIAQDALYVICGIVITYALFNYLVKNNMIKKSFLYFILTFLAVQLSGDLLFALTINSWPIKHSTKWINYFKNYINKSGFNALLGDSLYIIAWSLAFYLVSNYIKDFSVKIFIICLFFFMVSAYSVK